jgi:putative transcriptional regulator
VDSLRGQLLIASPTLADPNFARTVVLIADHDEDGALGVVLNRPTEATVGEAVPEVSAVVDEDQPVFAGGPVATTGVVVLAEADDTSGLALEIDHGLGFLGLDSDLALAAASTRRARAYAGHAGWGPGQLESEMEQDAWITEPATRDDVFCTQDEAALLWSAVLERKGGNYALVARMPIDPSVN